MHAKIEEYPLVSKIVTAQKLQSGDIHILFSDKEAKENLDKSDIWDYCFRSKTTASQNLNPVVVHGFEVCEK